MDWVSALWTDIVKHIEMFDFSPPHSVDQLMGWIGLLGFIYTIYRIVRRCLVNTLSVMRPLSHLTTVATRVRNLRRLLETFDGIGMMDPRLNTLQVMRAQMRSRALIMITILLLAFGALMGKATLWAIVGIGFAFAVGQWFAANDYIRIMEWITARPDSKIERLVQIGELYLNRLDASKLRELRQVEMLRDDLPVIRDRLAELRRAYGKPSGQSVD